MATISGDWELGFYSVKRVSDKEFVIKTGHSGEQNEDLRTLICEDDATAHATTTTNATHNGHHSTNQSAVTRDDQSPHTHDRSARTIHHGDSSHGVSHTALRPFDPSAQKSLETATRPGWPSLDLTRNMFDFLSPARLLGPAPESSRKIDSHHLKNPVLIYRKKQEKKPEIILEELIQLQHFPTRNKPSRYTSPPKRTFEKMPPLTNVPRAAQAPKAEDSPEVSPKPPKTIKEKMPPRPVQKQHYVNMDMAKGRPQNHRATSKGKPVPEVTSGGRAIRRPIVKKKTPQDIQEEEIALFESTLKDQFSKYDLNGDGTISRREAYLLLTTSVMEAPEKSEAEVKAVLDYIVSKMDNDHDQRISFAEYRQCVLDEPLLLGCFGTSSLIRKV